MSSAVTVAGGERRYPGGGFEKEEVEAFIEEKKAAGETEGASAGSTSSMDLGSSGLSISPWAVFSDSPDSSVVQVEGGTEVYPGGGFEKEEVEAFIEEKKAAGEEVIAPPEQGCLSNIDCLPDFICVFPKGSETGTCLPRGDVGVRIVGVIDSKTCPYCRGMIGTMGNIDSVPLPPYHKHCRCSFEYLE
jgi:hypothetical protein